MEEKPWDYREAYGSKDQLHAIGAFITVWNNVELAIFRMQHTLMQIEPENFSPIFDDQSNSTRIKLLKLLAEQKEHPIVADRVATFCKYANICVGNRNLITHSMVSNNEGKIYAQKIASGSQLYTKYEFSLAQIRLAVEQTRSVYAFGINLYSFMSFGLKIGSVSEGTKRVEASKKGRKAGWVIPKTVATLPEAPAQPASLTQPPRGKSEHKRKQSQS